jgi:signal transduction histidine kinase/HPt (histidine-containing phosphotransfer) domain-containing protein
MILGIIEKHTKLRNYNLISFSLWMVPEDVIMLNTLFLIFGFILLAIVLVLKYRNNRFYKQLELEKEKTFNLQKMVSEVQSELSLSNDQMKIEISERKKRFEAYIQIKNELSKRDGNRLNFLRNVSHEIRTPLNAINGMLTLIDETELTNEQQEYINISRYHTKEMLTLLNDINDFSDIKRGIEKKIACLAFSLEETLNNLHTHLNHKAIKKDIEFTYFISENVPQYICGDPIKLRKILFNLLDNAIKFTEKGTVSVRVYIFRQKEERLSLEFQIEDTGSGIPKDIENLLFQSVFCQADLALNRKYSGLGLGLAVAKELVSLMGGSISFQSTESQGTIFTFTANFERCPIIQNHHKENDLSNNNFKSFSFSDLNILLIDEKKIRVKIIHKILTEIGCHVDTAESLEQGVIYYNSKKYQALLFSFVEKNIHDDQWKKKFSNSHLASTPIIALTQYLPSDKEQKELHKNNIVQWLEVPVNTRDLINCIEKICRFSSDINTQATVSENSLFQMIDKEAALIQLGDENLFNDVLKVFIQDLPVQITTIKKALEAKDFDQISMHALSLKSSASTIMADQIKQIAFNLSVAGNDNNRDEINQLIINLETIYEQLKQSYYSIYDD